MTGTHYSFLSITTIALCILIIEKLINEKRFIFSNLIFCLFLICFIEMIKSVYNYNISLLQVIENSSYILIVLSYYIFAYSIRTLNKNIVLNIFMIFVLILSTILLFQYYLYDKIGFFIYIERHDFRFGSLRMTQGEGIINIIIIIAFGQILNNNKYKWNQIISYLTFFIGLAELILVQKTRYAILCVVVSCIIMIFIKNIKRFLTFIILFSILALLYFFIKNTTFYDQYISSLSNSEGSLMTRNLEIQFYLDQFKDHKTFGMGFTPENSTIKSGFFGSYFRDDVGIVGLLNTFGIVGFVWYILMLGKSILIILKSISLNTIKYSYECLGLIIFVILTSATLIITDPQRIVGLPIFFALLDYLYYVSQDKAKN